MNPYKSLRDKMLADHKNIAKTAAAIVETAEGEKDEEEYKRAVNDMYNEFIHVSLMCRKAMEEATDMAGDTIPEFNATKWNETAAIRAGEAKAASGGADTLATEITKPN